MEEGLTFERLCQVARLDEETGLRALEEFLRHGWLCEGTPAAQSAACEEYTVAGVMIRAVVSQEAGTTRQRLVQRRVAAVLQEETASDQGEEAGLPTPLDGQAAGETRARPPRRVVAGAGSRERSGMQSADQAAMGTTNWPLQMTRKHADAGICKKTLLAAWERRGAGQTPFAFPRSPPGSPASNPLRSSESAHSS